MCAAAAARPFRREPGDWPCQQCNEVNFKSRTTCRRCSASRDQPITTNRPPINAIGGTPQITPKQGDWPCHFCNYVNFAARATCNKCGRPKQEVRKNVAAPPSTTTPAEKPGDWKCSSCPEMNFGSRVVCRACGAARASTENQTVQRECVICMDKPIDSVIATCGHSALCLQCGAQVTQCPICRNPFNQQQLIKLFNVY